MPSPDTEAGQACIGGWAAWSLPGDGRHSDALVMLAHLGSAEQVLTTNLVVGETWTFLRRKDGHRTALAFLDRIGALQQQSKLVVHRVTFDQEDKAWASGRIRTPNGPE